MRPPDWPSSPFSERPIDPGPGEEGHGRCHADSGSAAATAPANRDARRDASQSADAGATLAGLYRRWRDPLVRWLRGRGGGRDDAEDLTQQVFARLWASGRLPADDHKAQAYLRQTARRLEIDRWRKYGEAGAGRTVSLDTDLAPGVVEGIATPAVSSDERHDPLRQVEQRQQLDRLRDALAELPARQGEALGLYLNQGLTQDQIAEQMGVSTRMVSKHISRGLAYCTLRLEFGSVEQMQTLKMSDGENSEGSRLAPGTRAGHG